MPIDMTEIEELAKRLRASNWWVQDYSSNEQLRREAADTIDSLLAEIKRGREALTECVVILETVRPENDWSKLRAIAGMDPPNV